MLPSLAVLIHPGGEREATLQIVVQLQQFKIVRNAGKKAAYIRQRSTGNDIDITCLNYPNRQIFGGCIPF